MYVLVTRDMSTSTGNVTKSSKNKMTIKHPQLSSHAL